MTETRVRQAFLLLLVIAISAAFVAMIRSFLMTIVLAAIFAALSYPAYRWLLGRFRGREAPAAIATLVLPTSSPALVRICARYGSMRP